MRSGQVQSLFRRAEWHLPTHLCTSQEEQLRTGEGQDADTWASALSKECLRAVAYSTVALVWDMDIQNESFP